MEIKEWFLNVKEWIFNKKIFVLSVILIFIGWTFCFKLISPGYVGVRVNLLGENKGVDSRVLKTGLHWISPWKKVYKFPTFMQNHTWEGSRNSFNFQTSEGLYVTAEIGISYHVNEDLVHILFQQYRRGIDEITHIFLRNYIRDAINKTAATLKIEDLYSTEKKDFFDCIEKYLAEKLESKGIILDRVYLIGRFHLPESVVTALNMRIEAIQRAHQRENELKESEAFARKQIALANGEAESKLVRARAESEANKLLVQSLSKELIVFNAIHKWDGKLPETMATGGLTGLLKEVKSK